MMDFTTVPTIMIPFDHLMSSMIVEIDGVWRKIERTGRARVEGENKSIPWVETTDMDGYDPIVTAILNTNALFKIVYEYEYELYDWSDGPPPMGFRGGTPEYQD